MLYFGNAMCHRKETDGIMKLREFLKEKLENKESYRQIEGRTDVSRGALEKIVKDQNDGLPRIETLQGIATGYKLPLWYVMEMAEVDLNLPTEAETIRLYAYAEAIPELAPFLQEIVELPEHQRREAVRIVRALLKDRGGDSTPA